MAEPIQDQCDKLRFSLTVLFNLSLRVRPPHLQKDHGLSLNILRFLMFTLLADHFSSKRHRGYLVALAFQGSYNFIAFQRRAAIIPALISGSVKLRDRPIIGKSLNQTEFI
jgi:hypothetical protein